MDIEREKEGGDISAERGGGGASSAWTCFYATAGIGSAATSGAGHSAIARPRTSATTSQWITYERRTTLLGADVLAGERPQWRVEPDEWQSAEADQGWTLVSCIVSPAFEFAGFTLAPPGWSPGEG